MKELFDVHCHMVPGVDDGAADLEESLAMLKNAWRRDLRRLSSHRIIGGGCLKNRQKRYMSSF